MVERRTRRLWSMEGCVGDKEARKPYGIFVDPSLAPFGKVDGVLSLGVPLTASAPAAGVPSPAPACRARFLAEHQIPPKRMNDVRPPAGVPV
jgi:hypothetical protein